MNTVTNLQLLRLEDGIRGSGIRIKASLVRAKEVDHGVVEDLLSNLHVLAGDRAELEASLAVELTEADPVLLVHLAGTQRGDLGAIDLFEPGRLLGDGSGVVLEHVHDKVGQLGNVFLVLGVLELALVVDVSKKVGVLQVGVVVLRVAEVLGRDEARLDHVAPGVEAQQGHGALAQPVGVAAVAELGDAVVLAAEGDQTADGREVATLDIAAQELAALGEADGVDGGGRGEDGMGGQRFADRVELGGDVAEEGGPAVRVGVGAEGDGVHKGARVDRVGQGAYLPDAVGVEGIAEAVPDDERQGSVVEVVVVTRAGRMRVGGEREGSCGQPEQRGRIHGDALKWDVSRNRNFVCN